MNGKGVNYRLSDTDIRCLERVRGMLPERIFDMHIHLYDSKYIPGFAAPGGAFCLGPNPMRFEDYFDFVKDVFTGAKEIRACTLSVPDAAAVSNPALIDGYNKFMLEQLADHPECMGALAVLPTTTVKEIEGWITLPNVRGFKCYHAGSGRKDSFNCEIGEYLPESSWQVANERGMFITLHMVRDRALSDPLNSSYIIEHCRKYPGAKLVLAHAGRGFCYYNTTDAIGLMRGLDNLYFDASAVCEPQAMLAILREFGPKKLLWGSDFPISQMRGKCITVADSFLWLYADDLSELPAKTNYDMALVGTENLLAMQQVVDGAGLTREDVDDIFWHNAMRLGGFEA